VGKKLTKIEAADAAAVGRVAASGAGLGQAGGCDGDDLGQLPPDPGRCRAQQCSYLCHLIFLGRRATAGRTMENGLWRLSSRYLSENNDRPVVRMAVCSRFIAAIEAMTKRIFSAGFARPAAISA
jgi:hypothetical protein